MQMRLGCSISVLHLSHFVRFLKIFPFLFPFPQPALHVLTEYGIRLQVIVEERCAKARRGQQWRQKK